MNRRNLLLMPAGFAVVAAFASTLVAAPGPGPRGEVIELHSCQVYTGGCTASSEATLGGRSLLRAWRFEGGSFAGVELAGLAVAALQTGETSFAFRETAANRLVVYVPPEVNAGQARALTQWVLGQEPGLPGSAVRVLRAPVEIRPAGEGREVAIGETIRVEAAPLDSCDLGGCGEQLWYEPRSDAAAFAVLANRRSVVAEPALELRWDDHGKASVFVGRFGESPALAKARLESAELCGNG